MDNKEQMKKTCNGCRALEYGLVRNYCWECSLGYDIDPARAIPREQCPKPKTIAELIKLGKYRAENVLIYDK